MPVSAAFRDFVLDQLQGVGDVRARGMFGGAGLYNGDRFFGVLDDDVLYFKVDEATRPAYEAAGMGPFRPFKDQPEYVMAGYYQVPADVLEDRDLLREWALGAIAIATRSGGRGKRASGRQPKTAATVGAKTARDTETKRVRPPRRGGRR